jgi:transposase
MEENRKLKNLKGHLEIMKAQGIKPNFSELERVFGKHRQTIQKYYDGYEGKSAVRNRPSKLDKHYEEIKAKISLPGITQMGLYQYIFKKDNEIGSYSNFKKYLVKHNLKPSKSSKVHLRYETEPGEQLQFDWKEDITMISKHGEVFEFNILTSTLGYSRLHDFVYSRTKTREDVERCLMTTFKYIGGVPKQILTDNMRAVVDINGDKKKINPEFNQFAKDMGTIVRTCKYRSPETKGKVETANKFMAWLIPYNHEFSDEEELLQIIKDIRDKANSNVNQTTNIPPILLFEKEKEYLLPLPNNCIMLSYLVNVEKTKVYPDSLIYYKGQRYSVSPKYIGQNVQVKQTDNILYIYHNKEMISTHEIGLKIINYAPDHYKEGLKIAMPYRDTENIDNYATENLRRLDRLLVPTKV